MKLILKWLVICLLLLVIIQILICFILPIPLEFKQSVSFLLGMLDGSICMNSYLYERRMM